MSGKSTTSDRQGVLVTVLAGLIMIGPFSIDTMFPGFPAIRQDLSVSALAVQQTVSVYLLAYALMSLVHGPVSDRFGRRPVIALGMVGYALASAGAATATTLDGLLLWRCLQGACAGAGIVVARAVIRDLFEGPAAQKLMSQVMMIFGIAPAIAPVVGAQLVLVGGWRGIFWALAIFASVLVVATLWLLPESLPREQRVSLAPRSLVRTYSGILRDAGFWPLAISGTLNFAALFVYILSAPRVVLELMGLSQQGFPWLFVPVIGGIMSGSLLSSRLAGKRSAAQTVGIGYVFMAFGTLANLLLGFNLPTPAPVWALLPLCLIGCGVGLCFPTLTLLLLDRFPLHRGGASSLQAFVSLLFNAALAGLVAPALYGSLRTLAAGAACISLLGWLAWRWYVHAERAELARHAAADAGEMVAELPPSEVM
ncbi:MAG: multidrug effflux MFS transporter [Rhodanobacteraceae bacterium]